MGAFGYQAGADVGPAAVGLPAPAAPQSASQNPSARRGRWRGAGAAQPRPPAGQQVSPGFPTPPPQSQSPPPSYGQPAGGMGSAPPAYTPQGQPPAPAFAPPAPLAGQQAGGQQPQGQFQDLFQQFGFTPPPGFLDALIQRLGGQQGPPSPVAPAPEPAYQPAPAPPAGPAPAAQGPIFVDQFGRTRTQQDMMAEMDAGGFSPRTREALLRQFGQPPPAAPPPELAPAPTPEPPPAPAPEPTSPPPVQRASLRDQFGRVRTYGDIMADYERQMAEGRRIDIHTPQGHALALNMYDYADELEAMGIDPWSLGFPSQRGQGASWLA
jgi:hypothetical protein